MIKNILLSRVLTFIGFIILFSNFIIDYDNKIISIVISFLFLVGSSMVLDEYKLYPYNKQKEKSEDEK